MCPIDSQTTRRRFTCKDLAKRGWTPFLVRQFAPKPDVTVPGRYSALYEISRIEQIEASPEFRTAQAALRQRADVANLAAAARRKNLLDWAASLEIRLPIMEWKVLVEQACDHYNARKARRQPAATSKTDASFLHRICVNYLRHNFACYHVALKEIRGKLGADKATSVLRARILQAIATAYPQLGSACDAKQWRYDGEEGTVLFCPPKRRRRISPRA